MQVRVADCIIYRTVQKTVGTVPGPQSMAFSCFPDSKSHILIWLSSELEAATVCMMVKDLTANDDYYIYIRHLI